LVVDGLGHVDRLPLSGRPTDWHLLGRTVTRSVTKTPRDGTAQFVTDETSLLSRARWMVTGETDRAV